MRFSEADRCAFLDEGHQCERKREPTRAYCDRHDYEPPKDWEALSKQHWVARCEAERKASSYREALAEIEEILFDDLRTRATEKARKKVMSVVSKALYGGKQSTP